MKKFCLCVIAIILCVSMVACRASSTKNSLGDLENQIKKDFADTKEHNEKVEASSDKIVEDLFAKTKTYTVFERVSLEMPKCKTEKYENCKLFIINDIYCVAVAYSDNHENSGAISNAIETHYSIKGNIPGRCRKGNDYTNQNGVICSNNKYDFTYYYPNIIGSKRITSGGVGYDLAVDNNTFTIYGTVIDGKDKYLRTDNAFKKDEEFTIMTKIVNNVMDSVKII